jgi:hypothetical protein
VRSGQADAGDLIEPGHGIGERVICSSNLAPTRSAR